MHTKKENVAVQRNSSIELLRILSMIGVVILHYNNGSIGGALKYAAEGSCNQYYLYFTENIFIIAVNLFMIISAYFLVTSDKRKIIKIVELIIQVIAFRFANYLITIVGGEELTLKGLFFCLLPINYFVILYSVVYILSPYFNLLIQRLDQRQLKKFVISLFVIFSVWSYGVDLLQNILGCSMDGLSTVGAYGSQLGYTIVNFVLLYFVGAYIRKNEIKLSIAKNLCAIIVTFLMIYVISLLEHWMGLEAITTWNYNNPLLIIFAALVFLLFIKMQFQSKIINELSKGAFTCFLVHIAFLLRLNIKDAVNGNFFALVFHQIGTGIALYLISYVVYKIYYMCSHWFIKLLKPSCDKINIY